MTMRKALIWSALMHIAAIAVMWFGLPTPGFESTEPVVIIAVDIADFSETPERKAPRAKPKPPEPVVETPPEPPPAPKEPDLAMIPPPPAPEPVPEPPAAVPAPAEAEDKPKTLLPARPRPKPTPPKPKDDFVDNILKTIDVLDRDKPAKPPPPKTAESEDFLDDLATLLDDTQPPPEERAQLAPVLGNRLTASEEDVIRRQIKDCWNTAALVGARNPEELVVELRLQLRRDGSVISVEVVDKARLQSDRFFRAAADSARRAVTNPKCSPFLLPPDKYDNWKDGVFVFNPADMVGR